MAEQDKTLEDIQEAQTEDQYPNINIDVEEAVDDIKEDIEPGDEEPTQEEQDKINIEKSKESTPPWLQKRLDEMAWKVSDRDRKINNLTQQVQDLSSKQDAPVKPEPKAKPSIDNYETEEEFYEALTDWKIDQREATKKTEDSEQAKRDEATVNQKSFEDKRLATMEKGFAKYEDFTAVVANMPENVMTENVAGVLVHAPNSEDVAYFLGKNLPEAQRIAALNPVQIAIELGAIGAKLKFKPQSTKSNAPEPIEIIEGKDKAVMRKDPSEMTDAEYSKWYQERKRRRR